MKKDSFCKSVLHIILLCVLLMCYSCTFCSRIKTQIKIRHEFGKEVDFSWPGYQVLSDTILPSFEITKPITIVTHINVALCSSCFSGYLKAAERYVNMFESDSLQLVCIAYPRQIDDLQSALSSAGVSPQKVMVVYDIENLYLSSNSIDYLESGDNAFLLDNNHKILLLGDPIRFKSINEVYTSTILSMIRKEEWL